MNEDVIVAHRSPTKRKGFAQIPHAVLVDPTLSDAAVRLYGVLLSYAMQADSFRCSQEKMAKDFGKEDRTIRRLLKELEGRGLLTVDRPGKRLVNAYILEDAYALYDQEQPRPKQHVRTETRPDKNVLSPDRTKMSSRSGQKSPVVADRNVPLLNTPQSNTKEKDRRVSPSALEEKDPPVTQSEWDTDRAAAIRKRREGLPVGLRQHLEAQDRRRAKEAQGK